MATARKDLVDFLAPFVDNYRHPSREKANDLLHQLRLIQLQRQRMQVLAEQARTMGVTVLPYIVSDIRATKQLIAEARANFTVLARKYADAFPDLDAEVLAIPLDNPYLPDENEDI